MHALGVFLGLLSYASSSPSTGRTSFLSNVALPIDSDGNKVITGEVTVLQHNSTFYVYLNNWGGCPGIDCCANEGECSSCCFSGKPEDACVYTSNHSVVSYSTVDFETWTYLGIALNLSSRLPGIEFRPQVVYNGEEFLMWYEDRWPNGTQKGYALASSSTPGGPFETIQNSIVPPGAGRIGDYDIFIDPSDGIGYHVRTGMTVVQMTPDLKGFTSHVFDWSEGNVEGPAMFKRGGLYYVSVGVGCCACRGGSSVQIWTSSSPLGPYTLQGDIGNNHSQAFNASSPLNYVTHAQQSKIFSLSGGSSENDTFVWLGNQWVTATTSTGSIGGPRNQDLLYWAVLEFNGSELLQMVHLDNASIPLPGGSAGAFRTV